MAQKIHNTASVKRTISKATEALITAKCQLNDLFDALLNTMELVYGEGESDKCCSEIYDRLKPINEYVETAIIDSIHCKTLELNSTEF